MVKNIALRVSPGRNPGSVSYLPWVDCLTSELQLLPGNQKELIPCHLDTDISSSMRYK